MYIFFLCLPPYQITAEVLWLNSANPMHIMFMPMQVLPNYTNKQKNCIRQYIKRVIITHSQLKSSTEPEFQMQAIADSAV